MVYASNYTVYVYDLWMMNFRYTRHYSTANTCRCRTSYTYNFENNVLSHSQLQIGLCAVEGILLIDAVMGLYTVVGKNLHSFVR